MLWGTSRNQGVGSYHSVQNECQKGIVEGLGLKNWYDGYKMGSFDYWEIVHYELCVKLDGSNSCNHRESVNLNLSQICLHPWPCPFHLKLTQFTLCRPCLPQFCMFLESIHERSWLTNRLNLSPSEWKNEILYPLLRTWLKYQAELVLIYWVQNIKFQAVGS